MSLEKAEFTNEITLPAEGLTDAKTFAEFLKISPSMLTKLRKQGLVKPPVKIGSSARWNVAYVRDIASTGLTATETTKVA